jgi:hypothetical protein
LGSRNRPDCAEQCVNHLSLKHAGRLTFPALTALSFCFYMMERKQ